MEKGYSLAGTLFAGVLANLDMPTHCPMCNKAFEGDELIHRACLLERHGGTLPEGFDELIEAFELESKDIRKGK